MIIELPGGIKDILLGYCVLSKRKGGMTECQSHSMLEKYPQWKQINVSLWALENNDTGLIWYVKLINIANKTISHDQVENNIISQVLN